MSSEDKNHKWRIFLKNLETMIGVGIHPHEQKKQRVIVSAYIEGIYPAKPQDISECFNYEYIYDLVIKQWPQKTHKPLLENCAIDLLEHIFSCDNRVTLAKVSIAKPDIFPSVEAVGVEVEWNRQNFTDFCNKN